MYLNQYQTKLLGEVMSTLVEPHEEHEVRAQLGEQMLRLFGAQYYASYVWDAGTRVFGSRASINMDPNNLLHYEQYFQFHDPLTPLMHQYRTPVRATDVMSHDRLKQTEFFNDFLYRDGLYWGVNLYAWDGQENIGDIRVWRDRKRENFSTDELQLLDLIRPAFVSALRRCRGSASRVAAPRPQAFVRLSEREVEVAQLMSCGLSDKEISRRLGISLATVRTHIGHAFRKHGVDSRVKLVQALGR